MPHSRLHVNKVYDHQPTIIHRPPVQPPAPPTKKGRIARPFNEENITRNLAGKIIPQEPPSARRLERLARPLQAQPQLAPQAAQRLAPELEQLSELQRPQAARAAALPPG
jgi:hypothetical protein